MKLSWSKALFAVCVLVLLSVFPAYSQETKQAAAPAEETPAPATAADLGLEAKEIAIYGEIQSIDAVTNSISVQYYDYDSDSEKTINILVAPATKLENASSLTSVKKGDWVDVTYVAKDGKSEAKVVTVEKEETPAAETTPAEPAAPSSIPQE